MKYKLEVWVNGNPSAIYRDNDIENLVKIFKEDWDEYEDGRCEIYLYKDGCELSDEEIFELGFVITGGLKCQA